MHGPAGSLADVFRERRVSLAPLRFGAGIKGKISDSWWYGVPVVSSSIGAEGMGPRELWGGLVADDTESFVDACVRLHEGFDLWKQSVIQGEFILKSEFTWSKLMSDLLSSLDQARKTRGGLGRDWIRQMMSQSFSNSYRYFGKWIQEKQKGSKPQ